jgi:hypothetical protein
LLVILLSPLYVVVRLSVIVWLGLGARYTAVITQWLNVVAEPCGGSGCGLSVGFSLFCASELVVGFMSSWLNVVMRGYCR